VVRIKTRRFTVWLIGGIWVVVALLLAALAMESSRSARGVEINASGLDTWFPCVVGAVVLAAGVWLRLSGWNVVPASWIKAAVAGILIGGGVLGFLLDTLNRSRDEGAVQALSCTLASKWIAEDKGRSRVAEFHCGDNLVRLALPWDLWDFLVPERTVVLPVRAGYFNRAWVSFDEIKVQP
jgi:hypothetical protein